MVRTGNIYIPYDEVNREDFIESCFRRKRVSIITKSDGVLNDCVISVKTLQDVNFPKDDKNNKFESHIGSSVVFTTNEKGLVVVLEVISNFDEILSFREGEQEMFKSLNGCFFKIKGSAKDKSINIIIDSDKESMINIKATGDDSKVNLFSQGEVNVNANKLKIEGGESLEIGIKSFEIESKIKINEDVLLIEDNNGNKISMEKDIISINDGENGGLINIKDLVEKLNALTADFNGHIVNYNAHFHLVSALPNPSGATIPNIPTKSQSTKTSNFIQKDIEDSKVIH